jgi:hypothetical protein
MEFVHDYDEDDSARKLHAAESMREHPMFILPWEEFVGKNTQINSSFGNPGGTLFCIDEGVEPESFGLRGRYMDAVYLAGSGVLAKKRDGLLSDLRGKVTSVASHHDCAACAAANKNPMTWSAELAKDLGVPYEGHIHHLSRPPFHDAAAIYIDGTGRFQSPKRGGLPRGLTLTRWLTNDEEYFRNELALAFKVVLGNHGLGAQNFDPGHPLKVIAIGASHSNGEISAQDIHTEIADILSSQAFAKQCESLVNAGTWNPDTIELLGLEAPYYDSYANTTRVS